MTLPFDFVNMFGQNGFDTGSVEPMKDYTVVPPGKYVVQITDPEITPTKSGSGHYIRLILAILEGEHKNRKIWDRVNIDNPDEKCREMALAVMSAIGRALKIAHLQSVTQLANGVLVAHVKVKGEQNEVRTYSSIEDYRAEQAKKAVAVVSTPSQATPGSAYQPAPQQAVNPPATAAGAVNPQQPWARPQ